MRVSSVQGWGYRGLPYTLSMSKAPSPFMGDILPSNKAPSPFMGEGHGVRVGMPAQLPLDDCSTSTPLKMRTVVVGAVQDRSYFHS